MTTAMKPSSLSATSAAAGIEAIEVTRVADALEKDRFIKFPWRIYQNDLHWVPPLLMERHEFLDPAKNPFYLHADVELFVARRGGEIVGRIAAIEDRNFNDFHHAKTAYFGLFECVNDPAVAAALVSAARDWARWRGLDTLLGPMNLSTNYEIGLLVEGFDSDPYLQMPYNPRYYGALLEQCGLKKAKDLYAWERSAATPPPERFGRIAEKIRKHEGITLRAVNLRDFDAEVGRIKEIYNAAWEQNWGFVPMTDPEFDKLVGPMNLSTNYEIGLLVEGFDSDPYLQMPYNPRYYGALLEQCGLEKAKDLYAWERSAATPPPERFGRIADKIRKHEGITLRAVNLRDFEAEVARIKEIYNAAWEQNWGFVPMTDPEFDKLAKDLRQFIDPELALIAEHEGEPVAFSLTVPDYNQALKKLNGRLTRFGLPIGLAKLLWNARKIDRVRLMALGVKQGWRRRGLDAVLIVETIRRTRELGYAGGEVSWTLEDNDLINRAIESTGCTRTKLYRMYEGPTG